MPVVEVTAGGKQLDAVEAMRRDLSQVRAFELLVMVQVGGNAEAPRVIQGSRGSVNLRSYHLAGGP